MKALTFEEGFKIYLRGGFPLVVIDSIEVDRVTSSLAVLTSEWNKELPATSAESWLKDNGYKFMVWDCVNGWRDNGKPVRGTESPEKAIAYLVNRDTLPGVYVMQNLHLLWNDALMHPIYIQLMRDFAAVGKSSHKHLIIAGSCGQVPQEIQRQTVMLDFSLPDKATLKKYISEYSKDLGFSFKDKDVDAAAEAALGMTLQEIEGALCTAIIRTKGKTIDREIIFDEKANAVKRSGLLEYIKTDETMDSIGGLDNLKAWYTKIAKAFTDRKGAVAYGLPTPKGALIIGQSGAGKSLSAKAVASLFGVPLFRVDIGKIFGSLVGSTEASTRELLKLIDAVSPAVFLFDELEKALSGLGSSDSSDSGVTARMIGSILYWMEEKKSQSFIVATANDVSKLPPELLRKGRWDELWYVDLPTAPERKEIFKIHIQKAGRDLKKFKALEEFAKTSEGFTGAEIAGCIRSAMFNAFYEDREFTDKDIHAAIKDTIPLTKLKGEEITALREWARFRTKFANDIGKDVYRKTAKNSKVILN